MKALKMQVSLLVALTFSVAITVVVSSPVPESYSDEEYDYYADMYPEEVPESPPASEVESLPVDEEEVHDHSHSDEDSEENPHQHHDHTMVEPIKAEISPADKEHRIPQSCTQAPVTGMCRGAFPMFYFDPNTRTCKQFVYGGCLGNKNVHKTSSDCYKNCYPQGLKRSGTGVPSGRFSQSDYLTVRGGTGASTLTFTGKDAAAKVDPPVLSDFTITGEYAFEFHFRTDKPHGLIAFLRQISVPEEIEGARIQLYIYLKKGHLAVTHVLTNSSETFVMRRGGLQGGNWHSASVQIDSKNGEMTLDVDGNQEFFTIGSLAFQPHYGGGGEPMLGFASILWVGGVFDIDVKKEDMVLGFLPFHGCIQQMSLSSGPTSEEMVGVKPLVATRHTGVKEHCANNCNDRYRNMCSRKSHCVEHFDHSTCNCFNSGQDGPRCTNPAIPVLSLNGDGYVVHRLYEWMDRVHSYTNLISVGFKTRFTDSILLYASAEHPERQYIAASITRTGTIYVEVNLGGGAVSAEFGEKMDAEIWHTLSIVHQHEKISLYIDSTLHETLIIPGNIRYFHLDPEFYLGNAPDLSRACGLPLDMGSSASIDQPCSSSEGFQYHYDKTMGTCRPFNYTGCGGNANRFPDAQSCIDECYVPGLRSLNTFMGCMQNVFFNDMSVLQSLRENNKTTKYLGSTKDALLGTTCNDTKFLSVTFSTERAAMNLINPEPQDFHLIVSFRPTKPTGVLASGEVDIIQYESVSQWELRHDRKHVYFYIHDNLLVLKSEAKISIGNWHYVEIRYKSGRLNMMVNNKKQGKAGPGKLHFSSNVTIGKNILEELPGFVGCIRKLTIGGTKLDLRTVVGTPMVNEDVTYDNCQVLGPCEGPRSCEHGGKCTIDEEGQVHCDCSGTGYTGKQCHFSLYKKSCEQYRQIGFESSGIYHIDIDGNGPLPPVYVHCSFSFLLKETYTIVEHNVEEQYEVRRSGINDFQIDVTYRDFSPEMMTTLISQSKSCSQEIEYQCRRAPLHLSTETWFSSPSKKFLSNFGTKTPGICRCKELRSCEKPDVVCNCDINDGILRKDKAIISDPENLPITSMFFLQGVDQREDSEAHFTLKPLKCASDALKEHTVSFTEASSYLEVPAWREGSLSLTFRTTSEKAIVAYQPAYHPRHATFMISLVGARNLEFMYRYQGQVHHQVLRTTKPLNDGQWQQVLVDVYNHQLRFVINSEEKIIDVDPNAYLGVLDGSMFLGGIPEQFQATEGEEIENLKLDGLIGCIRGLTLNDEVVDMERLFRASSHGVSLGCTPSCDPNPCQNGAHCVEMWGTYKCECANPLAHSGKNCQKNINEDGITFMTEDSKYKYFDNDTIHSGEKIINETLFINFRTHSDSGLILFAYNYLHNFVQLHLASENEVVFLFNYGSEVKKLSVTASDGVVFNNGQPVQVKVTRTNTSTDLSIFTDGSLFKETTEVGVLLLLEEDYEQFPFGESQPLPEMVYYPHSMTKPRPFFLAYLGSANDKQHDIRSDIRGITGCLRGLKIGENKMPLTKLLAKTPYSTDGVVADCKMACDQKPCLNGGKCTEDFQFFNNFRCDCTDTSYTGATCNTETSYTFYGNQWISQDSSSSSLEGDFKFELAFSTYTRYSEKQAVALLRSTDPNSLHDYLLVWICPHGSIVVEAQMHDYDEEQIHGVHLTPSDDQINAFDGLRHYVIVEKKDGAWTVKIDGDEREIKSLKNVYISDTQIKATPTALFLGGLESDLDARFMQYHNFRGCVSNVRISTPTEDFYPLRQYSEGDLHLKNRGIPGQGRCAAFAHFGGSYPLLMAQSSNMNMSAVIGTEWVHRRPEKIPFHSVAMLRGHPERDTVYDNAVPTAAGIVFAITLLIVIALLLKSHFKKKKQRAAMEKGEGKTLLLNGRNTKGTDKPRTNTMLIISDNQESVPLMSAPDGIPKSSPALTNEVFRQEKSDTFSNVPLTEAEPAGQDPAEDGPEVPEVAHPAEEKESFEAVGANSTEEAQVHSDAAGESEKLQVRRTQSEEGEIAGRPLSWDKSTDNLPLIIGQEGTVVGPTSREDSTSESSIECTLDINSSPAASPTSSPKPVPDGSGDGAIEPPSSQFPVPEIEPLAGQTTDDDSDPEPVLKKYVLLSEGTDEPVPSESKSEAAEPSEQPEEPESSESKEEEKPKEEPDAEELKPGTESESEESPREELQADAENEIKTDFSKVPIIKIERSESEDGEVVVDDEPEADQIVKESEVEEKVETETAEVEEKVEQEATEVEEKIEKEATEVGEASGEPDATAAKVEESKHKTGDTDNEFIDYRDASVKVEDAQRMSKVLSHPPVESPVLLNPVGSVDELLDAVQNPKASPPKPEERIDLQRYYFTRKPSIAPALPPKERRN